jgi:glucan phosphoethanolaminetransferase (alkaline phosphatase superfamily)
VSAVSLGTWIVVRSLFSQNEINYTGTQFAPLRDIFQTLELNILGTFPSAAWSLSEVFIDTKSLSFPPVIIPVLLGCAFGIILLQYLKLNYSKKLIFGIFILFFLWVGSSILHSLSTKNVNEITQLGKVYYSYGVGFVGISFAISVVLIWLSLDYHRLIFLKLLKPFLIFFGISFFLIQNYINLQLLGKQINDYREFETIINSTVMLNSDESVRCQLFFKWKPNYNYDTDYQNDYYLRHILKGLDEITMKERRENYCSSLYIS